MAMGKQFEEDMNDFFLSVLKGFGFDVLTSRLFSMLFMEPEEISMDELAETTGYSLSGVSSKLKLLEGIGMIQRIKKPGTKKLYFKMESDIKEIMRNKIQKGIEIEINPAKQKIPRLLEKYKKQYDSSKDKRFKKQYEIVEKYYDQMIKFEKIMFQTLQKIEELM